jgi:hypothetical protein
VPEPAPADPAADPFAHPDAQRRFRILHDGDELRRALDFPWDRWAVFLHPAQRDLVERRYAGPARVTGSAGTGKTIVALHRAVHLARRHPKARVLLTTFSKPLAKALAARLASLVGGEPAIAARVDVQALTAVAYELYGKAFGQPNIASGAVVHALLRTTAAQVKDAKFPQHFLDRLVVGGVFGNDGGKRGLELFAGIDRHAVLGEHANFIVQGLEIAFDRLGGNRADGLQLCECFGRQRIRGRSIGGDPHQRQRNQRDGQQRQQQPIAEQGAPASCCRTP